MIFLFLATFSLALVDFAASVQEDNGGNASACVYTTPQTVALEPSSMPEEFVIQGCWYHGGLSIVLADASRQAPITSRLVLFNITTANITVADDIVFEGSGSGLSIKNVDIIDDAAQIASANVLEQTTMALISIGAIFTNNALLEMHMVASTNRYSASSYVKEYNNILVRWGFAGIGKGTHCANGSRCVLTNCEFGVVYFPSASNGATVGAFSSKILRSLVFNAELSNRTDAILENVTFSPIQFSALASELIVSQGTTRGGSRVIIRGGGALVNVRMLNTWVDSHLLVDGVTMRSVATSIGFNISGPVNGTSTHSFFNNDFSLSPGGPRNPQSTSILGYVCEQLPGASPASLGFRDESTFVAHNNTFNFLSSPLSNSDFATILNLCASGGVANFTSANRVSPQSVVAGIRFALGAPTVRPSPARYHAVHIHGFSNMNAGSFIAVAGDYSVVSVVAVKCASLSISVNAVSMGSIFIADSAVSNSMGIEISSALRDSKIVVENVTAKFISMYCSQLFDFECLANTSAVLRGAVATDSATISTSLRSGALLSVSGESVFPLATMEVYVYDGSQFIVTGTTVSVSLRVTASSFCPASLPCLVRFIDNNFTAAPPPASAYVGSSVAYKLTFDVQIGHNSALVLERNSITNLPVVFTSSLSGVGGGSLTIIGNTLVAGGDGTYQHPSFGLAGMTAMLNVSRPLPQWTAGALEVWGNTFTGPLNDGVLVSGPLPAGTSALIVRNTAPRVKVYPSALSSSPSSAVHVAACNGNAAGEPFAVEGFTQADCAAGTSVLRCPMTRKSPTSVNVQSDRLDSCFSSSSVISPATLAPTFSFPSPPDASTIPTAAVPSGTLMRFVFLTKSSSSSQSASTTQMDSTATFLRGMRLFYQLTNNFDSDVNNIVIEEAGAVGDADIVAFIKSHNMSAADEKRFIEEFTKPEQRKFLKSVRFPSTASGIAASVNLYNMVAQRTTFPRVWASRLDTIGYASAPASPPNGAGDGEKTDDDDDDDSNSSIIIAVVVVVVVVVLGAVIAGIVLYRRSSSSDQERAIQMDQNLMDSHAIEMSSDGGDLRL